MQTRRKCKYAKKNKTKYLLCFLINFFSIPTDLKKSFYKNKKKINQF